jgi:hypothetical protein
LRSLDVVSGCKVHEVSGASAPFSIGVASLSFDKYDSEAIKNGRSPDSSGFKDNPNAIRVGDNWYEIETGLDTECKNDDSTTQAKIRAAQDAFLEASKTITKI